MNALFIPAIQQSVLFFPLCLGIYLTYRVMQITDLTVEATFVTGAGVFAHLMIASNAVGMSIVAAVLMGAVVGFVVAMMQKITRLDALIVSVLAIFMMYSVNMGLMGRPNLSLLAVPGVVTQSANQHPFLFWAALVTLVLIMLITMLVLLQSRMGLLLRAFGDNRSLLRQLRISDSMILVFGLMVSNALAAISGVLTAVVNGYADINMSPGVALTAIGAVIIGLTAVQSIQTSKRYRPGLELLGCLFGVLSYFLLLNALLIVGVDPLYMKCVLGLLLLVFLSMRQYTLRGVGVCQTS
jgi:putative ABC transport system permease protein